MEEMDVAKEKWELTSKDDNWWNNNTLNGFLIAGDYIHNILDAPESLEEDSFGFEIGIDESDKLVLFVRALTIDNETLCVFEAGATSKVEPYISNSCPGACGKANVLNGL